MQKNVFVIIQYYLNLVTLFLCIGTLANNQTNKQTSKKLTNLTLISQVHIRPVW